MLQVLQNHSVCHHTDSQHSLMSFLWFQVIHGSTAIVGFLRSHDLDEILEIFYFFITGVQSNKVNKTLQDQT